WDTEPVREFLSHGRTGLLVAADDPEGQERMALAVLDDPAAHRPLAEAAAALVRERYARDVTLPQLAVLFDRLATRGRCAGHARPLHPPGLSRPVWETGPGADQALRLAVQLPDRGRRGLSDPLGGNATASRAALRGADGCVSLAHRGALAGE